MKKRLLISIIISLSVSLYAQESAIADAINKNANIILVTEEGKKKNDISLFQGWSVGLNFGVTKFQGDISQYDRYPAYQEEGDFLELRSAISFSLEKRINSLYSLSSEFSMGEFAGLRRSNEYLGYDVYDPWSGKYEGNGDKFIASYKELDLLLNINLSNAMTYFGNSKSANDFHFIGKVGAGINVFNTIRKNLFTNTYIYDFGYQLTEADQNLGMQEKPFLEQIKETVYIYGIRANYKLNSKMDLNLDYTVRNGVTDKWDASIMNTQYKTDQFTFISLGVSYKIGDHDYNNDWNSPIDVLKDDVSILNVRIEGFTDDSDNDGVADSFDKNPNTPLGVAVDGSGNALDIDMDNVPDYRDADPFSNRGALVDMNGIEFDDDKDGVPNSKDLENNTPAGRMVNQFGINVTNISAGEGLIYFPSIYFNSGSALVDPYNENRIATIALLLKNNPYIKLNVIGYTDNVGSRKFNKALGLKRANAVINYLILHYNIDSNRFLAETRGEEDPLSRVNIINDRLEEGVSPISNLAKINRRVDFEISY